MRVNKDKDGKPFYCGPTYVVDKLCVWATCFRPHDCGYHVLRGKWSKWVSDGHCITNHNHGCPRVVLYHQCCERPAFSKRGRAMKRTCLNCGAKVPVDVIANWNPKAS